MDDVKRIGFLDADDTRLVMKTEVYLATSKLLNNRDH